jgi:hypothetical protein
MTIPAVYQGSLSRFHGPVLVELDPIGTRNHGEPRFLATTPEGELLRQVRAESLDFSRRAISPPYCADHDIYGCPFDAKVA